MDPDANLKEQIRIASRIASDSESDHGPRADLEHDAARLAELVIALDKTARSVAAKYKIDLSHGRVWDGDLLAWRQEA